jgi:hypothetical protein
VYDRTFTKTGGIIYGDTDNTHTPGSAENTVLKGSGHTVKLITETDREKPQRHAQPRR